jgi:hypothetical protein
VRKGSVVDDQLGMGVDLFLLNCWTAGCQVLLSRSPSSRLRVGVKIEFYCFPDESVNISRLAGKDFCLYIYALDL